MKEEEVIVRKKAKKDRQSPHGGAWKVAYADFVTALMALFLVLWLVAMLSIEARKGVAEYFRSYTIFKGSGAGGGKGISLLPGSSSLVKIGEEPGGIKKDREKKLKIEAKEMLVTRIEKLVRERLRGLEDRVLISTTQEGVRLELVEKIGSPMFELGKANLLPKGKEILRTVSDAIKDLPNKIAIEGHTDALKYSRQDYTNWELAADRANAARRELLKNGIDPSRISKVISFGDVAPIRDRYNPINRRVSILIEVKKKVTSKLSFTPSKGKE